MNSWIITGLSAALGIAAGVGIGYLDFAGQHEDFRAYRMINSTSDFGPTVGTRTGGHPEIQLLDDADFDFGVMARLETRRHSFQLKNVGTAPLRLSILETTCKCTVGDLSVNDIPPGATTEVSLEWTSRRYEIEFRQSATIKTNDPLRPTLTLSIHGRVEQIVRPTPEDLVFSRISPNEANRAELIIYGYRDDKLSVIEQDLVQRETAQFFEVETRPLPAEDVAREPGAKSGVVVDVTVKPGLPLGPIHQTLLLTVNSEDTEPLEIPIKGSVQSDISIRASRTVYDPVLNVIKLGAVKRQQGARATVHVVVHGAYRNDVRLTPESVDPENSLRISVGDARPINNGKVIIYPVTVEVPAGSVPVTRLGTHQGKLGRITFRTNHPEAPTLQVYVAFAVVE